MRRHDRYTCPAIIIMALFLVCATAIAKTGIADRKRLLKQKGIAIRVNEKEKVPKISASATLNDYITIGLARNPGLKAAFYEWQSAFNKIAQSFSLPDPQITFTEYIEEVETRVGAQQRALAVKQKFPLPDKLWIRKNKAFKTSEAAYYNFEKKRLDLLFQISDTYYEYAYLSKAILLTEENMKLLKNFENVAGTKYSAGLQKNQDLLKVQVELGKLENELYSLKDLRSSLTARLNALLNLPAGNDLPWPDESLEDLHLEDEYQNVNALAGTLKKKNPELLALSENVAESKESLKLSKREYFPDLTLGLKWIETDEARNSTATFDSGKDPVMLFFSMNVPLWFGRLQAGVRDARASLKAAENQAVNAENELLSRLSMIHYKMSDAFRQSHLYQNALIPKAIQTVNAIYASYAAGGSDFLALIDAQRVLLNFQLIYYRHNANFYQRLSELQSILGLEQKQTSNPRRD